MSMIKITANIILHGMGLISFGLMLAVTHIQAATLPQFSPDKHMGVATCASGVCHGKSAPDTSSQVMLNEYRTWLSEDDHSNAYKTLMSSHAKSIANKLGLTSAHTAKICLDCHADNVPKEQRGRRFQISDGIGCEACHGGSERWLSDHSEVTATHQSNIQLGLYPSEQPRQRAALCLSCHLGTKDKFATHKIMGAGHPRLSFELESFTFNQPAHYKIDADYEQRKGSIQSVNMWLSGLVYKAQKQLELLQSERFVQHGLFPELAFYECHACHRPMAISRMPVEQLSSNLPAGTVRLDDAALVLIASVLDALNHATHQELIAAIKQFHQASLNNKNALLAAAIQLQTIITSAADQLIDHAYTAQDKSKIRMGLLDDAVSGLFKDYSSAEQAFIAVETLSIDLKDDGKIQTQLDSWFDSVKDEDGFIPAQFSTLAHQLRDRL